MTVLRVENPQEMLAYRPSFVGAYQTIFSQAPYYERFFPNEAEAVLQRGLETPSQITLLQSLDPLLVIQKQLDMLMLQVDQEQLMPLVSQQ